MYPLWEYFHSKNPFHVLFKGIQELFQKPKTRFHYKNFFINCFWNPGVSGQFPAQEHFQELWNSWWISTARTFWWTQELFSGTQELCFFAKQIIWVHFHRKKRFMNLTRRRGTWRDAEEPDETPRNVRFGLRCRCSSSFECYTLYLHLHLFWKNQEKGFLHNVSYLFEKVPPCGCWLKG